MSATFPESSYRDPWNGVDTEKLYTQLKTIYQTLDSLEDEIQTWPEYSNLQTEIKCDFRAMVHKMKGAFDAFGLEHFVELEEVWGEE